MNDGIKLMLNDDGVAEVYDDSYDVTIHCETEEEQKWIVDKLNKMRWIPVEERLPDSDKFVLISFENFPIPQIGRYEEDKEGGTWYVGDDDVSCSSCGIFVNAWMPLPERFKHEEN